MNKHNTLVEEIEQQFVDRADDWRKFLVEVNKAIKKFNPEATEDDIYSYDTLCQSVLDAALSITKDAAKQGQTLPPSTILKDIYKRLITNKIKDVEIKIVSKTSDTL